MSEAQAANAVLLQQLRKAEDSTAALTSKLAETSKQLVETELAETELQCEVNELRKTLATLTDEADGSKAALQAQLTETKALLMLQTSEGDVAQTALQKARAAKLSLKAQLEDAATDKPAKNTPHATPPRHAQADDFTVLQRQAVELRGENETLRRESEQQRRAIEQLELAGEKAAALVATVRTERDEAVHNTGELKAEVCELKQRNECLKEQVALRYLPLLTWLAVAI